MSKHSLKSKLPCHAHCTHQCGHQLGTTAFWSRSCETSSIPWCVLELLFTPTGWTESRRSWTCCTQRVPSSGLLLRALKPQQHQHRWKMFKRGADDAKTCGWSWFWAAWAHVKGSKEKKKRQASKKEKVLYGMRWIPLSVNCKLMGFVMYLLKRWKITRQSHTGR